MNGTGSNRGRWLLATYRPVSLFTLKTTYATSKGGKTLLVPTPYSVKLALVDACYRAHESAHAERAARDVFDAVKNCEIRFSPPDYCVVQNTFVKVKQEETKGTYASTIAYREFCFFQGDLTIALGDLDICTDEIALIKTALRHVNYFGKRGSFFQYIDCQLVDEIAGDFSFCDTDAEFKLGAHAIMQSLDDIGDVHAPDLFDRINSYRNDKIMLGKHRVLRNTFLPYRLVESSKSYSLYAKG